MPTEIGKWTKFDTDSKIYVESCLIEPTTKILQADLYVLTALNRSGDIIQVRHQSQMYKIELADPKNQILGRLITS